MIIKEGSKSQVLIVYCQSISKHCFMNTNVIHATGTLMKLIELTSYSKD